MYKNLIITTAEQLILVLNITQMSLDQAKSILQSNTSIMKLVMLNRLLSLKKFDTRTGSKN